MIGSSAPGNAAIHTALIIAERAHAGQTRRDGVTPFILHPLRVAVRVGGLHWEGFVPPVVPIVTALLHDTVEDVPGFDIWKAVEQITPRAKEQQYIVDYVRALTKVPNEPNKGYYEYIIREGWVPITVKLCDMLDNLTDLGPEFGPEEREHFATKCLTFCLMIAEAKGVSMPAQVVDLSLQVQRRAKAILHVLGLPTAEIGVRFEA